ncbi:MAG: hypothetical protein J6T63_06120 [Bacteroidales bacterium]|nr:hypothetical protein [Bacteroidales bacterium]
MKRIVMLFIFVLAVVALFAQNVPQTVNFSAVLRDTTGNIMADTQVRLRLSFLEGSAVGQAIYVTEKTETTNPNGFVSFLLNRGMPSSGAYTFADIPWENGNYWLKVDYKTDDMNDYRTWGVLELASNFYSFVASKANKLEGIDFYVESPENGDALMFNSETGRFESQALIPPRAPALSTVLEAGNDAGGMNISDLAAPIASNDIVTKEYADSVYHRIMTAITNINCSYNGHEYVDLGLPSGTMWAKCNVGAPTPESIGGFYAWGEIYTKDIYNRDTYVYAGGTVEQGDTLPADCDVASVFWGGGWHIPMSDEMNELRYYCAWKYVQQNGRYGFQVTGPSGSSIFLPCGGYMYGTYHYSNNVIARYVTGSGGIILLGLSNSFGLYSGEFYTGCTVRPVFRFENND